MWYIPYATRFRYLVTNKPVQTITIILKSLASIRPLISSSYLHLFLHFCECHICLYLLNYPNNSESVCIFKYGDSTSETGFAAINIGVIPNLAAPSRFLTESSIYTVSSALHLLFLKASMYSASSGLNFPSSQLYVLVEK